MFKKSLNVNDAWFGFYSHFKKGTFHVHMNNFQISRQKYSTNMATGRYVMSRENDLGENLEKMLREFFLMPPFQIQTESAQMWLGVFIVLVSGPISLHMQ